MSDTFDVITPSEYQDKKTGEKKKIGRAHV